MKKIELSDDNFCFVCGKNNDKGLKINFELKNDNTLYCEFIPAKWHQGFVNLVHGGIIGLILDESMVNLLWRMGKNAVSVEFKVRLKKTAYIGNKLYFTSGIEKEEKRIIYTYGVCKGQNKEIVATAEAKCMYV